MAQPIKTQLSLTLVVIVGVACLFPPFVIGHARLWEPAGRSTLWRRQAGPPINYNDNELYCGGFQRQVRLGYKCGVCGDPYDAPIKENEAGGRYAQGILAGSYTQGQEVTFQVDVTANHRGFFEFRLCPVNDPTRDVVTEDCLAAHPVQLADGSGTKYHLQYFGTRMFDVRVRLPADVSCDFCVLQFRYHTGNSWGVSPDGTGCLGCGPQEEFYACSDIRISPSGSTVTGSSNTGWAGSGSAGSSSTGSGSVGSVSTGSGSAGSSSTGSGSAGSSSTGSGSVGSSSTGTGSAGSWSTGSGSTSTIGSTGSGSTGNIGSTGSGSIGTTGSTSTTGSTGTAGSAGTESTNSGTSSSNGGLTNSGSANSGNTGNSGNSGNTGGGTGSSTSLNGDRMVCEATRRVPGLRRWCQINCQMGNCPSTHCVCRQEQYTHDTARPAGCRAAGAFANVSGYDQWCAHNCPTNCPSSMCTCN